MRNYSVGWLISLTLQNRVEICRDEIESELQSKMLSLLSIALLAIKSRPNNRGQHRRRRRLQRVDELFWHQARATTVIEINCPPDNKIPPFPAELHLSAKWHEMLARDKYKRRAETRLLIIFHCRRWVMA